MATDKNFENGVLIAAILSLIMFLLVAFGAWVYVKTFPLSKDRIEQIKPVPTMSERAL